VPKSVRHWFASPRAAIGFLLHAARLDTGELGARRNLTMPGIAATVGEQIEALRKVKGEAAVRLIRDQPDATIMLFWRKSRRVTPDSALLSIGLLLSSTPACFLTTLSSGMVSPSLVRCSPKTVSRNYCCGFTVICPVSSG